MKQIATKIVKGNIVIKTGLHIGAGNDKIEIGGMDNPIIRNPKNNEPYIPGSSIKGKMRSLLEWKLNKISKDGGVCSCGKADCPVCRVFGTANNNEEIAFTRGPTRLIVRDAILTEEFQKKFKNGEAIVEEKSENTINRVTAVANPRPIERVVSGVEFDFEMSYRVIDTGDNGETDNKNFESVVLDGLKLLQNDYLGGGGTRGNGQIEFKNITVDGKSIEL